MVAIALMTGVIATAQENKSCQEKCCKEKPCKEKCCESKGKCKDKAEMVRCQTQRMVEKYGLNEEQAARLQALNEEYAGKLPKPGMRGPGMRPGPGKHGPRPGGIPCHGRRDRGACPDHACRASTVCRHMLRSGPASAPPDLHSARIFPPFFGSGSEPFRFCLCLSLCSNSLCRACSPAPWP